MRRTLDKFDKCRGWAQQNQLITVTIRSRLSGSQSVSGSLHTGGTYGAKLGSW